jgi:hypothetical protein
LPVRFAANTGRSSRNFIGAWTWKREGLRKLGRSPGREALATAGPSGCGTGEDWPVAGFVSFCLLPCQSDGAVQERLSRKGHPMGMGLHEMTIVTGKPGLSFRFSSWCPTSKTAALSRAGVWRKFWPWPANAIRRALVSPLIPHAVSLRRFWAIFHGCGAGAAIFAMRRFRQAVH